MSKAQDGGGAADALTSAIANVMVAVSPVTVRTTSKLYSVVGRSSLAPPEPTVAVVGTKGPEPITPGL